MPVQSEDPVLKEIRLRMPDPPRPLISLKESARSSAFFSTEYFSISRALQNSVVNFTGASMWTHPQIAYHLMENMAHEILKDGTHKEDGSQITQATPENTFSMLNAALKEDASLLSAIYDTTLQDVLTDSAQPPQNELLYRMSASSFFWGLFADPYVRADLPEDGLLLLGNAFLFARWKEDLECGILLPLLGGCSSGTELMSRLQSYLTFKSEQRKWNTFSQYSLEHLDETFKPGMPGARQRINAAAIQEILTWSPWIYLIPVIQALSGVPGRPRPEEGPRIKSGLYRACVEWLYFSFKEDKTPPDSFARCMLMQGHRTKRLFEWRFKLAIMAQWVLPKASKNTRAKCSALKQTAMLLIARDNLAIDLTRTGAKQIDKLSDLLLKNAPKLKELMMEAQPALSEVTAEYLSGVWHDMWLKVYRSHTLRMLVLVTLAARGGLFLSAQKQVIDVLVQVVRLTLQALW